MYHNGLWGTICKDGWNIPDATVVCRMLGYSGAWTAGCCTKYYPGGTVPIWLSDLSCTGEEKSLTECGHSGWAVNNCDHGKDVEVICHSPPPTEKPSGHSSAVTRPTIQTSQSLLPSGTAVTTPKTVSSDKSTTIQRMSQSLSSSTITPYLQKMVSVLTPSTQVSSTSTSFKMSQNAPSSSTLFTVVVPSVVSPSSSSVVASSSVTPTLPPGR